MTKTRRLIIAAIALAALGGLATTPWRGPTVQRLAFEAGGARIEIGAVRLGGFVAAALAQSGQDVTLENVTVSSGPVRIKAPRITFDGASLDRAALAALFDAGVAGEPMAARLAKLSATRVVAPELVYEQDIAGQSQTTIYQNLVATGIVNGAVKSITADGATLRGKNPEGEVEGSFGRMSTDDLDMAAMARVFAGTGGAEPGPMSRIYGSYAFEGMVVRQAGISEIRIARMSGRDFLARPAKRSFSEILADLPQTKPGEKVPNEEAAKLMRVVGELFDTFAFGTAEMSGMSIRNLKDAQQADVTVQRIAITGEGPGRLAETRLEGFAVTTPEAGQAKIGAIVFSGYSFASTIAALKDYGAAMPDNLTPEQMRRLIPQIGSLRFSGFDFDIRPKGEPGEDKPEPVRFTMKDLEIRADKVVNGIPTEARIALDGFRLPIDPATTNDGLKGLAAMGYRTLDLSFTTAAAWREAASELELSDVTLRLAEMGSAKLSGTIGNVTREAFDADSTLAMVAWLGATAKRAELTIENSGLFERALQATARDKGKSPDAVRREFAAAATVGIPASLGNSATAKELGRVVGRFVAKPGKLVLRARTKEPLGLGVADLASLQEPADILEQLEITANAE